MHIPALNELGAAVSGEPRKYPANAEDYRYMVLFPEDYEEFGIDPEGNLALLVDEENAREVKRLAEKVLEGLYE